LLDQEFHKMVKRIKQNGITKTKPSALTRKISLKTNYIVYNNRHKNESIIIDEKKLRKLLGTNWF